MQNADPAYGTPPPPEDKTAPRNLGSGTNQNPYEKETNRPNIIDKATRAKWKAMYFSALTQDRRISHGAHRLLHVLHIFADENGGCFPGQRKIQHILGCSTERIKIWLQQLIRSGYIQVTKKGRGVEYKLNYREKAEEMAKDPMTVSQTRNGESGLTVSETRNTTVSGTRNSTVSETRNLTYSIEPIPLNVTGLGLGSAENENDPTTQAGTETGTQAIGPVGNANVVVNSDSQAPQGKSLSGVKSQCEAYYTPTVEEIRSFALDNGLLPQTVERTIREIQRDGILKTNRGPVKWWTTFLMERDKMIRRDQQRQPEPDRVKRFADNAVPGFPSAQEIYDFSDKAGICEDILTALFRDLNRGIVSPESWQQELLRRHQEFCDEFKL